MPIAGAGELTAMLTAEAEVELLPNPAGGNVNQRCLKFTHGLKLYLDYRFLCDSGHPSVNLAHSYVEPVGPGEPLVFTELHRHASDSWAWLTATCSGLVWAAAAVDMLTEDRPAATSRPCGGDPGHRRRAGPRGAPRQCPTRRAVGGKTRKLACGPGPGRRLASGSGILTSRGCARSGRRLPGRRTRRSVSR